MDLCWKSKVHTSPCIHWLFQHHLLSHSPAVQQCCHRACRVRNWVFHISQLHAVDEDTGWNYVLHVRKKNIQTKPKILMPWLLMASGEFPFTDIKYRKTSGQCRKLPQVSFFSPFFVDLSMEKPAHIKGLILSGLCFTSMHSDSHIMPVKITVVSQQSPSCIQRCVFAVYKHYSTWQVSVQRKNFCLSETRTGSGMQSNREGL